jgi:hypothetical protein
VKLCKNCMENETRRPDGKLCAECLEWVDRILDRWDELVSETPKVSVPPPGRLREEFRRAREWGSD